MLTNSCAMMLAKNTVCTKDPRTIGDTVSLDCLVCFVSYLLVGLDKICLATFEQNGQPKERSNSASKMGCQFCQKSKLGKE